MTSQEIIEDFNSHLEKSKKSYYSDFFIGVTGDIEQRLFSDHCVPRQGYWYIFRDGDEQTCRDVEKHFLDLGMRGNEGGGTDIKYVYCYEVSQRTNE